LSALPALGRDRPRRELSTPLRAALVLVLLYLFLVGVSLLEDGIAGLGDGFQSGLLENVANPVSGLFAGILFTVLVQSSSVSTAAIVGMVGSGTLTVELAVPMIMGANIGTTITNTLASLGAIRRSEEFRRGFAAATVHDFFNLMAVAVLLPIELVTGVLSSSALWLTERLRGGSVNEIGKSPVKRAVDVPVDAVERLLEASPVGGRFIALTLLVVGLGFIFVALSQITRNMRQLVAGSVERAMNRIVGRGGGAIGILVGIAVTVAVQSSSITTSILVPLVAAGVLTLPNAYPITLGANIGTTITALIASLAVLSPNGLTIALVHTLFNVGAIALLYPIRAVRLIPLRLAERMADQAVARRSVVLVYVLGLFVVIPLLGVFLIP
jgi:solute carrier family 34 (sodium-dependent phosphate cotransporter)